jgi:addiction module HigA family antidote
MPCQHPGKVLLKQYLEPHNISQNALARAIKVPPRRINEIVHEKRAITADTAVRLAVYFNVSATYWMHLQSEYEIDGVKDRIKTQLSMIHLSPQPGAHPAVDNETSKQASNIRKRLMR